MKKNSAFEYLRILATLAVVTNHVCAGLFNNYGVEELGRVNSAFLDSTYTLVSWGVPVFLMITGALLLSPQKEISVNKIKKYVSRMAIVLISFGGGYSVIELIFTGSSLSISTFFHGYLNMLERNSWSHMWYVYILISLYLITIPIKCMLKEMNNKQLDYLITILIFGNIIITTINDLFGTSIYGYMQFGIYLMWYLMGYYLYYRIIPYLKSSMCHPEIKCIVILLVSSLLRYFIVLLGIIENGAILQIGFGGGILEFVQSISLFVSVCLLTTDSCLIIHPILNNISRCSFSIYLIHPVIVNVLYKVFGITPLSFPVCLGISIMLVVIFGISWFLANVMIRIPILKKVV